LLRKAGWVVLRFWEHQVLKVPGTLARIVANYVTAHAYRKAAPK
jgi:very-short-patch-repair endonuclease